MTPSLMCGFARAPHLLLILGLLLGHPVFAQDAPDLRIDSVSRYGFGYELNVAYSTDQGGIFEVEHSEDLTDWQLWAYRSVKVTNESGGSGEFRFVSSTGSRFFRMKRKDNAAILAALELNRAKWDALEMETYEYETRLICYCRPEVRRLVRVSVASGEVDSVRDVTTGETLDAQNYGTVEGLFDRVEEALDELADYVRVQYDPFYGYPLSSYFAWYEGSDSEYGYDAKLLHHVELTDSSGPVVRGDAYSVSEMEIEGNVLRANVSYSGGCALHTFSLSMDPDGFMESNPVQLDVYLSHADNGDSCDSIVQEEIEIDLTAIRSLYQEQFQALAPIRMNVHSLIDGVTKEEASLLLDL